MNNPIEKPEKDLARELYEEFLLNYKTKGLVWEVSSKKLGLTKELGYHLMALKPDRINFVMIDASNKSSDDTSFMLRESIGKFFILHQTDKVEVKVSQGHNIILHKSGLIKDMAIEEDSLPKKKSSEMVRVHIRLLEDNPERKILEDDSLMFQGIKEYIDAKIKEFTPEQLKDYSHLFSSELVSEATIVSSDLSEKYFLLRYIKDSKEVENIKNTLPIQEIRDGFDWFGRYDIKKY